MNAVSPLFAALCFQFSSLFPFKVQVIGHRLYLISPGKITCMRCSTQFTDLCGKGSRNDVTMKNVRSLFVLQT